MLKSDGIPIFVESFGQKEPENRILCIFLNILIKIKVFLILVFPCQISCLVKFLFWSYCTKCSWPIRLQDPLKCNIFKKMRDQIDFCLRSTDFSTSWCYCFWWAWLGIPELPKISLQYLCNISRKRWGINMIFYLKINIKVSYKPVVLFQMIIITSSL